MSFGDANHLGPAITLFAGAGVVLGADVFTDRRAPARSLALLTIRLLAKDDERGINLAQANNQLVS